MTFIFALLLLGLRFISVTPSAEYDNYECAQSDSGYIVPHPKQCDRYVWCHVDGSRSDELCPDGMGINTEAALCDHLTKIDCSGRPNLQPSTVVDPSSPCLRANGLYPLAPTECTQFYECKSGSYLLHQCPSENVFDTKTGACVHPDQTSRIECQASIFLGVDCPGSSGYFRFGNHDRLPHPQDCSKFVICLANGKPRISTCPPPKVFDPESGFCRKYKDVPSCSTFYDSQ